MPRPSAWRGERMRHRLAVELDRAVLRRRDAEQRQGDVGAAGADEAREAQHLAAPQLERDVLEHALAGQARDLQQRLARPVVGAGEELGHVAPDHVLDREARRDLRPRPRRDPAAVAQHRHAVGDLEHLVQAVADEQDRHAARRELPHLLEELCDLVRGERRRGLVHDQHAHVERDGLGDLDGLLRGHRQRARGLPHVHAHVEAGEDGLRVAVHPAPAHEGAAVLVADEDVLRDVEVGEDRRLLVDRRDPVALRVGRALERHLLAVAADRPGVRRVDAGHDLDQRRLAGAVLAQQRVHLARVERQRHVGERLGGVEALGDALELEDRRGHGGLLGGAHRGYAAATPPSTLRMLPVDFAARAEARKAMASATSSGRTSTPSVVRAR